MEPRKIWEIIRRRKWIIIQSVLVISLTAIIGSFLATPVYETSAKVLIESDSMSTSSLLSGIGLKAVSSMMGMSSETEVYTYIELATLDPIIERVISMLQLRTRDGTLMTSDELRKPGFILSALFPAPHVMVDEVEDTDLIQVCAISPDPEQAAMIANAVAEAFIEGNLNRRREEYGNAKRFIEGQIKSAKADFSIALEGIKRYQVTEKTLDLKEETKKAIEKMADLMEQKEDNIIDIAETKAKIETLKAQLGKNSRTAVPSSAIRGNPQIKELKKTLGNLEVDLAGMLAEKRQDHIDMKALKNKLEKAKQELKKEIDIFQKSSPVMEELERDLAALEAHLNGVNVDIDKYLALLNTIPQKSFGQAQLKMKLHASQDLYSSLLKYLYQIGVAEAMTLSDIRLVEPAPVPKIDAPKRPKKTLIAIVGLFLGSMFGFGLAFFLDYLDDTIKTPEEIKEQGITFLGTVPKFRKKEHVLISDKDPKDYLSESYRTIRNSIKFVSLDKPVKSLLITSCLAGEGKTTTTVNLGISISREGKTVLLLDADLRKPTLHTLVGLSDNSIGLSTVLSKEAKPEEAIKKTHIEGLRLLSSGPVPPDPGRMVESKRMRQLIEDLSRQYDSILLDTPPILVASDSIALAEYADAAILVLESEKVTRQAFTQVQELLRGAQIKLSGVLLNKFKIMRESYYYYYHYKGGDYKTKGKRT